MLFEQADCLGARWSGCTSLCQALPHSSWDYAKYLMSPAGNILKRQNVDCDLL